MGERWAAEGVEWEPSLLLGGKNSIPCQSPFCNCSHIIKASTLHKQTAANSSALLSFMTDAPLGDDPLIKWHVAILHRSFKYVMCNILRNMLLKQTDLCGCGYLANKCWMSSLLQLWHSRQEMCRVASPGPGERQHSGRMWSVPPAKCQGVIICHMEAISGEQWLNLVRAPVMPISTNWSKL